MSNIIPFENITVPAYLMNRKANNDVFAAGLPQGGGFPVIALKGTRFVVRADGAESALDKLSIGVVLVTAKPNLDKTYYASKFDPNNTEAKAPDCFSRDGVKPDAEATLRQHESCAGCPMNQFGSGTDNQGNPSKGKACSDSKMLALYANNGIYGFKVPPASLKAFTTYVKETSRRGVDLSTAITVIGFDPNFSFPVLTFNFGGFLGPEQIAKIDAMKRSDEVLDIVGGTPTLVSPAVAAAPIPAIQAPVVAAAPVVAVVEPTPAPPVEETPDPFATIAAPAQEAKKPAPRKPAAAKPAVIAHDPTEAELNTLRELGIEL